MAEVAGSLPTGVFLLFSDLVFGSVLSEGPVEERGGSTTLQSH